MSKCFLFKNWQNPCQKCNLLFCTMLLIWPTDIQISWFHMFWFGSCYVWSCYCMLLLLLSVFIFVALIFVMKQLPNWQIQMQNHENKSWVGQSNIFLTPQPLFTIFLSSLCFVLNCLLLFLIFVLSYIIKLLFFFLWLF